MIEMGYVFEWDRQKNVGEYFIQIHFGYSENEKLGNRNYPKIFNKELVERFYDEMMGKELNFFPIRCLLKISDSEIVDYMLFD